ncbi:hypothetical protein [Vibrio nigripulchritudo]|uniref:hypothetical protein n=1 Tax=Vibrio nigripulchritudo TaxID=28173 RepID=UPI0003B225AA|nr:hypothetical protein [Vibrio nigripulchritudo]CCO41390.1 hypothetical protein VIBNISFn135_460006 [Vibrio nigripulchritudo SFn135]
MICVEVLSDMTLLVHQLSAGESCQYIELVEQSQLDKPTSYLTVKDMLAFVGACVGLYGLAFCFNLLLQNLGFKTGN